MIEDQWRSETAELVAAVSRLQEENRRLQREKSDGIDIAVSPTESIGYDEQLWRKMGENNEKQRILLREKETQLTDKENVIDGV